MPERTTQIAELASSSSCSDSELESSCDDIDEAVILVLKKSYQDQPVPEPALKGELGGILEVAPVAAIVPLPTQAFPAALTLFAAGIATVGTLTSAACAYLNRPN